MLKYRLYGPNKFRSKNPESVIMRQNAFVPLSSKGKAVNQTTL